MAGPEQAALRPLGPDDPREIAGYRLTARIGEGGMGSVYLSSTRGNQPVALKVIRREYARDQEFRRRFEREVQAARRVRGYHIVPVLDHDTTGEQPWLATAYVPGVPLDEALTLYGPLPLPAVLQLAGCTARALQAVHTAGVVHRDLKPSNILLGTDGPWIIDFGIARAADTTQLTRSGGFVGTPQFMSPEHASGETVTPASDVFSLGLVAAVAATGRHPYGDGPALTVAARIANTAQRPPDLSGHPDGLRSLLERCLAAAPEDRPAPGELAELCEAASGRAARDFDGWLPAPLTEAIGGRARAVQVPAPPPEPSRQPASPPVQSPYAYTPTQTPGGAYGGPAAYTPTAYTPTAYASAPSGPYGAPTATAQASPTAPAGPTAPPYAPGPPYGVNGLPPRRDRSGLWAAGAALAVVAALAGLWTVVADGNGDADGRAAPGPSASRTADAARGSGGKTSGSPDGEAGKPRFEPVFEKRRITTVTPFSSLDATDVDMDEGTVDPEGDLEPSETELDIREGHVSFLKAVGKSRGRTPEECEAAAVTDPIPKWVEGGDINSGKVLDEGDLVCTRTSEGNLAMLEIVELKPVGPDFDPELTVPAVVGDLTVWKTG
ncbi:serine/threonine-protein kinase [Streptomyces glaucosporus]